MQRLAIELLESNRPMANLHFEDIQEANWSRLRGRALLGLAVNLLNSATAIAHALCEPSSVALRAMVYCPIGESPHLIPWQQEMIELLGEPEETPSLYYFKCPLHWGERLLDDGLEEYRRQLQASETTYELMYRSYRNRGDTVFQSGLYLFSNG